MIEEPTTAVVILSLTLAFFLAGFAISRAKAWLWPALVTLLCIGGLLLADWLVLTPRERVKIAVDECVQAFQENRSELLVKNLSPELKTVLKWDLTGVFDVLEFTKAFAKDVKIEYDPKGAPPKVTARMIAGAHFQARNKTSLPLERYVTRLEVTFHEFDRGQWLIVNVEEKPLVGQGTH
ncbi:MAG: hypothetical protein IJQ31_10000 [Thermoguttaceae bacterium]|nr:hypothetical protein [Thermoguttaceae bacterium]